MQICLTDVQIVVLFGEAGGLRDPIKLDAAHVQSVFDIDKDRWTAGGICRRTCVFVWYVCVHGIPSAMDVTQLSNLLVLRPDITAI